MEVWALEGFGVAHILQEMLTYKSDHIKARQEVLGTTIVEGTIPNPEDAPESFRYKHQQLRIGSVSPQQISAWSTKILPNGEIVGKIDGGKLMSSNINELYRRVIYRNNTLTDLLTTSRSMPGELVMCQEKLVQEAMDTFLDNGIRCQPMKDGHNKVYKSFSDVIEGKEGRFQETLLGKQVDYSGRSVIVVGLSLSLHRCGLPREIAIELFLTFEVMQGHSVLLNRAPTLHRLGIQAFQPILVERRAICLHPLVCKGFNADFDGDQMAVHVPLSLEAQAEARLLMFSHMNLLCPAIGEPISVPTQDMLMGLYVLTSGNRRGLIGRNESILIVLCGFGGD
ncbi:hypothetical protein ACH5RR_033020 [Cinchona calisaya]|uniref:DNA-directed RNA polymerase subunit n=1 Tax=Cinchona calisaya TaxID=153742 RepID=A0ABD2YKY2_9GENT